MAAGQSRGTILPAPNFHAERSAIKLQKALKGIGTDEKIIIEVLTSNSNSQRQDIKKKYKALYGKDLIEDLKADLSGHFGDVCLALLTPHEEFLVDSLHHAMKAACTISYLKHFLNCPYCKGLGTDERCLVDILCIQKPNEMETLTSIYKEKYGEEMENDMKEELSSIFKTLIRSLLSGGREESPTEEEDRVNADVQELITAVNVSDSETFAAILNSRSYDHLKQVFEAYAKTAEKDIEEDVKVLFTGDAEIGYTALVKIIKSEADYFAERLFESLRGPGTDDTALIRILVTHSETDLADIKERYKALYNKELSDAVADDTSGDYRKMLLKIMG